MCCETNKIVVEIHIPSSFGLDRCGAPEFFQYFNDFHINIKFTMEKERYSSLSFIDVLQIKRLTNKPIFMVKEQDDNEEENIEITDEEIQEDIKRLKTRKASGRAGVTKNQPTEKSVNGSSQRVIC
ncbi:hypothetical protein WA026_022466 [Henosepilachna vigintioctopunctata]|uniref:Uncharacterized protein n=1 Tax=Henosepilachna vigintioctopunctata TaxID=420089 RepID=A0AAW1TZ64_9CUCU